MACKRAYSVKSSQCWVLAPPASQTRTRKKCEPGYSIHGQLRLLVPTLRQNPVQSLANHYNKKDSGNNESFKDSFNQRQSLRQRQREHIGDMQELHGSNWIWAPKVQTQLSGSVRRVF
eukprot:261431-Amphidinium_carterae.1